MSGHTGDPQIHRTGGVVQTSGPGTDIWVLANYGTEAVQMCYRFVDAVQVSGHGTDV